MFRTSLYFALGALLVAVFSCAVWNLLVPCNPGRWRVEDAIPVLEKAGLECRYEPQDVFEGGHPVVFAGLYVRRRGETQEWDAALAIHRTLPAERFGRIAVVVLTPADSDVVLDRHGDGALVAWGDPSLVQQVSRALCR